jgi:hypothetical protein
MRALHPLRFIPPLVLATALGATAAVPTPAAATATTTPTITVSPSTGLAGGDTVTVQAPGLPPEAPIQIGQCGDSSTACLNDASATSDAAGQLTMTLLLADPVYWSDELGDSHPMYCRADACRILLAWPGGLLSSDSLEFTGSPATITANRTTNLRQVQQVRVRGTAYGAEGRTVVVVEEHCFSIIQETGCNDTIVLRTGTIRADGTYAFGVKVRRFLSDRTDCVTPSNFGVCQLTAHILDAAGRTDESFGVSQWGDPGVALTFRP